MNGLQDVIEAYDDALSLKGVEASGNPYCLTFDKFNDGILHFLKKHPCYTMYWEDNDSWGEGYYVLAPHEHLQDLV